MTPSPEPEERPSLLVKAPTLPKEVEESFEARALCIWAGLHERLAQLAEGKRAYHAFSHEIRDMKSKAIAEPVPSTPPCTRRSQAKMVPEVVVPAKKDAGRNWSCLASTALIATRAKSCAHFHELVIGKAPKKAPAAHRKAESAPDTPMASASMSGTAPPTILSPALDVMEIYLSGSGESEVEEEEEWICGLRTIPNRAIKPLPVHASMLSKEMSCLDAELSFLD
ncbi:hypothetical protein BDR03DRAFT_1017621 [Suillus americanus]|nr:hypothetical protein BDR03DRAFT_1017621 [Suillus americanus]